jgi:hypothetical protein
MAEKPAPPGSGRIWDLDGWDMPEETSPLRHPARALATVGAAIVACGVLLPWVDYSIGNRTGSVNGLGGDTWGLLALVVAGGLVLVLRSRSVVQRDLRWTQLIPAALGITSLLLELNAQQGASLLVDSYLASGDSASLAVGLSVLLLGSLMCGVGGVASSVVAWRSAGPAPRRNPHPAPGHGDDVGLAFLLEMALGGVAAVGGAVAGGVVALYVTRGTLATVGALVILSVTGGLVGAILADRLWRRFGPRR